jgi:GPI mannosyltransferase 2
MMSLTTATILSRFLCLGLLSLSAYYLPLFDASPKVAVSHLFGPLARWDVFHFQGIATGGYTYEHQWAFLPGTPILLRMLNNEFAWIALLLFIACKSTKALHDLTRHHFPRSPSFAKLVASLSLLSSSPATLYFAPYAEPFFTYLSYQGSHFYFSRCYWKLTSSTGMLYAAQEKWLLASFYFACATSFRSNGILLSGYIAWGLVVQPYLTGCRVSVFIAMSFSSR